METPWVIASIDMATGVPVNNSFPIPSSDGLASSMNSAGDVFVLADDDGGTNLWRDHAGTVTSTALGSFGENASNLVATATTLAFTLNGSLDLLDLASGTQRTGVCASPVQYAFNGSWVECVEPVNGVNQVFLVPPSGPNVQLSVYNTSSSFEALSATGQVMFQNGGDPDGGVAPGRYLRLPPALPERVSSTLGSAVAGCDGWYVKMGGSLLFVRGTEDAGTGCPAVDAGIPDGASDAGPTSDGAVDDAQTPDASLGGVTDAGRLDGSRDGGPLGDGQGPSGPGPATDVGSGDHGGGCAVSASGGDAAPWALGGAPLLGGLLARRLRRRRRVVAGRTA
jgi:MYXO-CTERM domain-containing protein